jgi:hypothetical protein
LEESRLTGEQIIKTLKAPAAGLAVGEALEPNYNVNGPPTGACFYCASNLPTFCAALRLTIELR